jgi:raffinose/stachyose/melibiose transport system permease protein
MATTTAHPPSTTTPRRTTPRATTSRKRHRVGRASWVTYVVAFALVGVCIGPVLYIIIGGFRTNAEITTNPSGFPSTWQFVNYAEVLRSPIFWRQVTNSVICGVFTTLGVVVLGVAASFVLARYTFSGRAAMYALFASGLMFPMTVAITPLYILIKGLGLTDNLAGIILPQIAFALPTTIIILVPFLRAIPKELEEAAATARAGSASSSGW